MAATAGAGVMDREPGIKIMGERMSPSQNTGVGSLSLLQEFFPTKESNPSLLNCTQILCQLSHKGSPNEIR